jgi:hypothetical protein
MKKPILLIAAIVAVVGFGAVVAVAKERTEVKTSASIKFNAHDPSDPLAGAFFSGRVKAGKGCQKGRTVVVYKVHGGPKASDVSNNRGKYKTGSIRPQDVEYVARVGKRKITENNGDKIVCKPGKSDRVRITP